MSRSHHPNSGGRPWKGKWSPLRPDTVGDVVSEVLDFARCFDDIKKALEDNSMSYEGTGPAMERRKQMLSSAQLRLDIMTHFYEAHKKDRRSERIKIAVRCLKTLLAQEGVDADPFAPELVHGPHSLSMREDSLSPAKSSPRSTSQIRRRARSFAGDASNDPKEDASPTLKKQHEELIRARTLQKDHEITHLNSVASELTGKMSGLEQENLKLERAMLEMCEGRERMKGIVEEQVYTVTLMTKVSSLLHFEMRRILFKTVARGIIFWCASFVLLMNTFATGGVHAVTLYMDFRSQFDEMLGLWSMLCIDLVVVSVVLGLLHEWMLFADYDLHHGSIHWLTESILMRRDDAIEAARTAAQKQAERIMNAEYIDLAAYQKQSTKQKTEQATSTYNRSETALSERRASTGGSVHSSPSHTS